MKRGFHIAAVTLMLLTAPRGATAGAGERPRAEEIESAKQAISAGSFEEAVATLERVIAANPDDADAQLLLGTALALIPRRSESIQALRRAVELRPDSAVAYNSLGMALARFGDQQEARTAYEKAIALDPEDAGSRVNLAMLLASLGELDTAAAHLTRAIEIQRKSPKAAFPLYLRGRIRARREHPESAAGDFLKAIELRPDYANAWRELGLARIEMQDDAGALRAFQRAAALAPEDAEAQYRLGVQYLRAGKPGEAEEHLKIACRLRPEDRNILYNYVRALRAAGNSEEAKPLMRKLSRARQEQLASEPELPRAGKLNNEGIALEHQGRFADALEKYREAVSISPRTVGFRKNLAFVLGRLGRWKEAKAELDEVLRMQPGDPEATKALYIAIDEISKSP